MPWTNPDLITAEEAAARLATTPKTLRKQLRDGDGHIGGVLVAFRMGTHWRVIGPALDKLLAGDVTPDTETAPQSETP